MCIRPILVHVEAHQLPFTTEPQELVTGQAVGVGNEGQGKLGQVPLQQGRMTVKARQWWQKLLQTQCLSD